ncbi:MAG: ATP-binding cassette domain-containing protein [Bacteroidales bacterium]|nr:ATP-binding cassette domain-containing protein [Bacteroidales bacterium]
MYLLESQHIEKNFGDFRALDDINIGVREGSIFGLLGPNGAGKTTLIRLINRISRPDKGQLLLDGRPMTDNDVSQIGYLPEERGLYKKMKVGEQAVYLAQLKGLSRRDATERLKKWFNRFEIDGWWDHTIEELSKGMQQKVQFIVTVLHEPRLLIFDEPFSGFDPVNATLLKNEIVNLRKKGATVIFSTHNMASVEELCDDIALINKSRVVLDGSVDQIRRSYSRNLYEVVVKRCEGQKIILPEGFSVESCNITDNEETMRVVIPDGGKANDLLTELLPQCQILSIKEILPSMNDIFIQTVQKGGVR